MTIAGSKEEDKSRSAFTHILDSDRSNGPLSFIIPLLCLKLYWGVMSYTASVIQLSSLRKVIVGWARLGWN